MKIIKLFILSLLVMIVSVFTSCTSIKEIEVLKMSDETISSLDVLVPFIIDDSKNYLTEEGFVYYENYLPTRTGTQELPNVTTTCSVSKKEYGSNNSYYLTNNNDYDCIVLYIHGGAYIGEIIDAHVKFCDKLAQKLNAKVCIPLYPLAPQATFDVAYEFMEQVYNDLLQENLNIYIMGDSAGGGFSLAFTQYLKENNKKLPKKLVLISPWVDVTMENKEIKVYEQADISLAPYGAIKAGKMWAGTTDRKDYRISPIYGNLDSLPDILMFVGNHEIVYPDDMLLYNNLTNTNIKVIVGEGFWHVYPIYEIKEQTYCIDSIYNFTK